MPALLEQSWGVFVPGIPKPKGSMRCVGRRGKVAHTLVEQVNNSKWRRQVKAGGVTLPVRDLGGPLGLSVTFTLPRPDSHYGTGLQAHRVLPSAPDWPHQHGTGDVDKLARLVFDAWQKGREGASIKGAGVFGDDAQIVNVVVWKCYQDTRGCPDRAEQPGAVIRIYPIGE